MEIANAFVGVVEWWLKNGMPYRPQEMTEKVGDSIREDYIDLSHKKSLLLLRKEDNVSFLFKKMLYVGCIRSRRYGCFGSLLLFH
ncbi:hypothetical protein JOC77_004344 [Peribacillus deserti]|uniref:Transcriptional regulator TetR C-terminal Firmicutes type domain-containing protein n=1 Tax=Peribacillus deserti TaxID=673318 RepID=A0ABS2QNX2_9BACI|nr:hypothetical protein [Peribacillus deserti]